MLRTPKSCLYALAFLACACRTRNPDDSGLLDSPPPGTGQTAEVVAAGGRWQLACQPLEAEAKVNPPKPTSYRLLVQGAVSPRDQAQALEVSLSIEWLGKTPEVLSQGDTGRGFVDPQGPIFIGFASGALTADLSPEKDRQQATHQGILTLSKFADAEPVRCHVSAAAP